MSSTNAKQTLDISKSLEATALEHGECWRIFLSGEVTSDIDPGPIQQLDARYLLFDLVGIDRLTSYGIRAWVGMMNAIDPDYCGFLNCRPPVITQFNMVFDFGGDGEILSLHLPYRCSHCGDDFTELVDLRDEYGRVSGFEVPDLVCPSCGSDASFDGVPGSYLEYVSRQGAPAPPDPVESLLDDGDDSAADGGERKPFRLKKEIVDDLTALWASGALDSQVRTRRMLQGLEGTVVLIGSEMTAVDPEAFRRLYGQLDCELLLARFSPDLLAPLGDAPELRERVHPITTVTSAECPQCGWTGDAEIHLTHLVDPDSPDSPEGCPECFGDLEAACSNADRAFYQTFDPPEVPQPVAQYLAHCKSGPESRSQTGDYERVIDKSFGPYELKEKIGSGGMAEIFRATKQGAEGFEREVVIKRLLLEKSDSPNLVEALKREAKLAARLNHPNIVQVTDFGRTNQFYYITMEHIDGPDIEEVLRLARERNTSMPVELAVFLGQRVCEALAAAHELTDADGNETPVVHRDVAPDNILVSSHGTPKLADFGIARVVTDLQQRENEPVRGKITVMAPEAVKSDLGPIDGRSDLFSLGTVLYRCLTGNAPFDHDDQTQALRAILLDEPPVPSALRSDVPKALDRIVTRAMAKRPDDRFPSARAMQHQLEEVLGTFDVVTERDVKSWVDEMTADPSDGTTQPQRTG